MFRAAELLRDTDMKVIDIAEDVGYCNASKFSGSFRDVMGTAPRDFQTEHKKRQKHKDLSVSAQIAYKYRISTLAFSERKEHIIYGIINTTKPNISTFLLR